MKQITYARIIKLLLESCCSSFSRKRPGPGNQIFIYFVEDCGLICEMEANKFKIIKVQGFKKWGLIMVEIQPELVII